MDTETYVLCQGKGSVQSILQQQQQVPGEQCERKDAQTDPLPVPSSSSPSAAAQLHISQPLTELCSQPLNAVISCSTLGLFWSPSLPPAHLFFCPIYLNVPSQGKDQLLRYWIHVTPISVLLSSAKAARVGISSKENNGLDARAIMR